MIWINAQTKMKKEELREKLREEKKRERIRDSLMLKGKRPEDNIKNIV